MTTLFLHRAFFFQLATFVLLGSGNESMAQQIFFGTQEYKKAFSGSLPAPNNTQLMEEFHLGEIPLDAQHSAPATAQSDPKSGYSKKKPVSFSEPSVSRGDAASIPGIDLYGLDDNQTRRIYSELDAEKCHCGCQYTMLECRFNDPSCAVSLDHAARVTSEVRSGVESESGIRQLGFSPSGW